MSLEALAPNTTPISRRTQQISLTEIEMRAVLLGLRFLTDKRPQLRALAEGIEAKISVEMGPEGLV